MHPDAAVVAAVVSGRSHFLDAPESEVERLVEEHRARAFDCARRFGGQAAGESSGDVLAVFSTAVDAVRCAIALQSAPGPPAPRSLGWRAGVHQGPAIRGDEIEGAGVSGALHLADLADPGGVVISLAVHDSIADKLPLSLEPLDPRLGDGSPVTQGASHITGAPPPVPPPAHPLQRALALFGLLLLGAAAAATTWIVLNSS
jgi:adenylate cyclase